MRLSEIFFGSVVFFFIFTAGSTFTTSLFEDQQVQDNTSLAVENEYDDLQNTIKGSNNSIQSKLSKLQEPESGVIDSAAAGLLLVPEFINVLTAPMSILSSALDGIALQFSFVPQSFVTFLKIMIVAGIGFAVFSIAIGKQA